MESLMHRNPNFGDAPQYPILSWIVGMFFVVFVIAFCVLIHVFVSVISYEVDFLGNEFSIYNFQTIITGVLALVAAWWTVRAIGRQVKQAEEEWIDRLARKSRASKSTMQFALAAVTEYAEIYAEYSHDLYLEAANEEFDDGADFPNKGLCLSVRCPRIAPRYGDIRDAAR